MMNKNCSLLNGPYLGFNKTKNGSKVTAFSLDYEFDLNKHKHVSWMYLDVMPDKRLYTNMYSLEEIASIIEVEKWFWDDIDITKKPNVALAGKDFIEWRGTVNKWNRLLTTGRFIVEELSKSNLDETLCMIEKWRYMDNGGMKYGWQERAGCDKALVSRYVNNYENIQNYVTGSVFKIDNEAVGYSCIETNIEYDENQLPEFKYLTRKVINSKGHRNLTEFIDYKTIELIHKKNKCIPVFLVNWGASSGGVHWYKTHKFPVYSLETKWFCSIKI